MRYLDEFKNREIANAIVAKIKATTDREIHLMEVCGTHTVSIFRSGIRDILPENIHLISGPGCPVCVTPNEDIDTAIEIAKQDVIFTTFGDMLRVPGSRSSLEQERANGADVRVVYSSLDALSIARQNPDKKVVMFAIGFETTSPTIAGALKSARSEGIRNFYILSSHKLIPPAMRFLIESGETKIDGFICPGHVSTIIGSKAYEFIPKNYLVPCVISGFEPLDILHSILLLVQQIERGEAKVENQYQRVVRPGGNVTALRLLNEVFEVIDAKWRGLGLVPKSGLMLSPSYRDFDAKNAFDVKITPANEPQGCLCGEVLRGVKIPLECSSFATTCTPETPVGPCMVSFEGTCSAYYKYAKVRID